MRKIIYPKLSYEVMSVLFSVHNELGSGLLEKHYQRAIELELEKRRVPHSREQMVRIEYSGSSIGRYFLDFVVDNKIVLEVKSTRVFRSASFKQAYSYLRQLKLPLSIVANFHAPKLQYKRIVNPDFKDKELVE